MMIDLTRQEHQLIFVTGMLQGVGRWHCGGGIIRHLQRGRHRAGGQLYTLQHAHSHGSGLQWWLIPAKNRSDTNGHYFAVAGARHVPSKAAKNGRNNLLCHIIILL
jgi:hypothetical protein